MTRPKQNGGAFIDLISLGVVVLIVISFILSYYWVNYGKFFKDEDSAEVAKWKKEAELVIVGTILNQHQRITQFSKGRMMEEGISYYVIDVESVERGSYDGKTIAVAVGWFSSETPPQIYPPFLKKEYHKGERIRIYVNHDPKELGYYTPALWYTIESVI